MKRSWTAIAVALLVLVVVVSVMVVEAQRGRAQRAGEPALTVEDYTPRSTLVVDANPVPRARFPVVACTVITGRGSPRGASTSSPARWTR